VDGVILGISTENLRDALLVGEPLAARAGGQVGRDESVEHGGILERESRQLVGKSALDCLEPGARVMRDQVDDAFRPAVIAKIARAIERMETGVSDLG
jgi:hypothetical protein